MSAEHRTPSDRRLTKPPTGTDRPLGAFLAPRAERAIVAERRAFARSTGRIRPEAGLLDVAGGCAVYTGHGLFSNRALGLGIDAPVTDVDLDRIERFYAVRGAPTEIELASIADPGLSGMLAERGYRLGRFRHIFALVPTDHRPGSATESTRGWAAPGTGDHVIERVDDTNRQDWSATLVDGFGYDAADDVARIEEWNDALLATPGVAAFLARRGAEPVGAASVVLDDGVAVLGGAATRPEHRRRGVQLALIGARLALARDQGCELAVVTADPESVSGRNCERAGFELVCTHAVMVGPGP
jgi:GNAT superfamily N-acetyltransferase